jgi:hypothetical protein
MNNSLAADPQTLPNEQGSVTSILVVINTALCSSSPVNQGIDTCLLNKQLTDNSTLEWAIRLRSERVAIQYWVFSSSHKLLLIQIFTLAFFPSSLLCTLIQVTINEIDNLVLHNVENVYFVYSNTLFSLQLNILIIFLPNWWKFSFLLRNCRNERERERQMGWGWDGAKCEIEENSKMAQKLR